MKIIVGARSSPLSKVQVEEVFQEIRKNYPEIVFDCHFASSPGDRDLKTSLRNIGKTDFFTRDLDEMLVEKKIQIAVHSAKDLPEPLSEKLALIAVTKGIDQRDSLVYSEPLKKNALIAVSSTRREDALKELGMEFRFIDIRGTIGERLSTLDRGEVDGVVIAEAALIRLKEERKRIILNAPTPSMQGRLAVLARKDDLEMKRLFSSIHHE